MEHRKLLYKSKLSALSPPNKRKEVHDRRASKRSDLYSTARNISLSPDLHHSNEDKENSQGENAAVSTTLPKITEKESRQRAYVIKFLAWKLEKAKKEQIQKEKAKRAPFVVPTRRAVVPDSNITKKVPVVPKDHVFDPGLHLNNFTVDIVAKNTVRCVTEGGKQGIYHLVGTPTKTMPSDVKVTSVRGTTSKSAISKTQVSSNSTTKSGHTKLFVTPNCTKVSSSNLVQVNKKLLSVVKKEPSKCPTGNTVRAHAKVSNERKALIATKTAALPSKLPTLPSSLRPKVLPPAQLFQTKTVIKPSLPTAPNSQKNAQNFKLPLKAKLPPTINKKPQTNLSKAAGSINRPQNYKSELSAIKRPAFKMSKKVSSTSISHAVTAVGLKSQSKDIRALPSLKVNNKSLLLQCMQEHTKPVQPKPETPGSNPECSYINFVTSTQRKASGSKALRADLIFSDLGNTISSEDVTCATSKQAKSNEKNVATHFSAVQKDNVESAKPATKARTKTPCQSLKYTPLPSSVKPKLVTPSQPSQTNSPVRSVRPSAKPKNFIQKPKIPPTVQSANKIHKPHTFASSSASSSNKPHNSNSGMPAIKRPTFKASKKASTSAAPTHPKAKDKSLLIECMQMLTKPVDPIPEKDTNSNSYNNLVKSADREPSATKDARADKSLLLQCQTTVSPVNDGGTALAATKDKLNFVRYSVIQTDNVEPMNFDKTPEKTATEPITYLSPFVTVSRGKVNTKAEKEKRNSLYMTGDESSESPETTLAVRRTLATVRYYRKQMVEEVARLDAQCRNWVQYKVDNAPLIGDGGIDIIDATVGQTKLLTTKKLKQFGGLIDRCEGAVLGKTSTSIAGEDGEKPILPEDLEGFWAMVSLQIEDIDNRFANLERWQANNWTDPDELLTSEMNRSLKNSKKIKKRNPVAKARPNTGLRKMLRAAHDAYLNKKANGDADKDIIFTPSKSRKVLIMNRRSFSSAATVITINKSQQKPSPQCHDFVQTNLNENETPNHMSQINGRRKSVKLLRNTLLSELEKRSPSSEFVSPVRQPMMSRKSILKTPGSISRPKGSVVFNNKLQIKFTIDDPVDTPCVDQQQSEDDLRTYKLRNRKIVLRDSAEFVIPK